MKIDQQIKLDFDDVLIKPNRSTLKSRSDVNLERTFYFYHSPLELTCIPIICSNLASVAGLEMAKALQKHKMITCLHKYIDYKELTQKKNDIDFKYVWLTIGQSKDEMYKLVEFCQKENIYPNLCVDVANGHIDGFVGFCKEVRNHFEQSIIMAGNVAAPECAQELIIHGGVDIIKGGTGSGSLCKTRLITGVGYPQLSLIIDVSSVVHGLKNGDKKIGLFCSDGGIKNIGDICKSMGAGADFTMIGGLFCGYEECCGEWCTTDFTLDGIKYRKVDSKNFKDNLYLKTYGMSSRTAQQNFGTEKEYRASEGEEVVYVKYKGYVESFLKEICGGLRSCCSYAGAESLKDLSKCTTFLLCNRQK